MCSRVLVLYFLFLLYFYHLFELTPTIFFKWPLVLSSILGCRLFLDRVFLHDSLWIGKTNMLIVWVCHDGVGLETLDQWVETGYHSIFHLLISLDAWVTRLQKPILFRVILCLQCGNLHILALVFFGLCTKVLSLFFLLILIIYNLFEFHITNEW